MKKKTTHPRAGASITVPSIPESRSPRAYEKRAKATSTARLYTLRLFVTGSSPRSTAAIETIRAICDTHLAGHFELEVVDLYQQPAAAVGEQIIAAPTLIKQHPRPVRRLVGSLADRDRVLAGLDIVPQATAKGKPAPQP